jgi:hypothetical protein
MFKFFVNNQNQAATGGKTTEKLRKSLLNVPFSLLMALAIGLFAASCDENEDDPDETKAPGAVVNFTASAGSERVSLAWDAPTDDGGAYITGYEVTRDDWANKVTKAANELTHTYTGLTNGTEYTFKVRAVNEKGAGAESTAKATPSATSNPSAIPLPTNLKLTFAMFDNSAHTVIKIGNDYYSLVSNRFIASDNGEWFLKYHSAAAEWIYYHKSEGSSQWAVTDVSPVSQHIVNVLSHAVFYSFILANRGLYSSGANEGTGTIAGRTVNIYNQNGIRGYYDSVYDVLLKETLNNNEVTSWDETVTGFGSISLPE